MMWLEPPAANLPGVVNLSCLALLFRRVGWEFCFHVFVSHSSPAGVELSLASLQLTLSTQLIHGSRGLLDALAADNNISLAPSSRLALYDSAVLLTSCQLLSGMQQHLSVIQGAIFTVGLETKGHVLLVCVCLAVYTSHADKPPSPSLSSTPDNIMCIAY